ncbi:hypothetical protein MMC10_002014 [Thelotrema lepadinum]|nr:hypothetical protein [Thelotrema lepadinum]
MSLRHAELVKTLPPRLIRFFERFPPHLFAGRAATTTVQTALNTSSADPNAEHEESTSTTSSSMPDLLHPFQRNLNTATGKWQEPMYSLRRQAELVKLAKQHGVEELLPFTSKSTEARLAYRIENGIRVKGTGVGQKVKGHWRERTLRVRLDKRKQAMMDMPKMIYQWKQMGHGRGWKKYPK